MNSVSCGMFNNPSSLCCWLQLLSSQWCCYYATGQVFTCLCPTVGCLNCVSLGRQARLLHQGSGHSSHWVCRTATHLWGIVQCVECCCLLTDCLCHVRESWAWACHSHVRVSGLRGSNHCRRQSVCWCLFVVYEWCMSVVAPLSASAVCVVLHMHHLIPGH
jgi:hypothetical protein